MQGSKFVEIFDSHETPYSHKNVSLEDVLEETRARSASSSSASSSPSSSPTREPSNSKTRRRGLSMAKNVLKVKT